METFSNVTSAASKAIWGDRTSDSTEPVSGETGNTSAGEPYDAGNKEPKKAVSGIQDSTTDSGIPSTTGNSDLPGNTASTGPLRPEHDTDKTGVTSAHQPTSGFSSDKPTSSNDSSGPGANPSVGAAPASAPQDTTKHQGADKPSEEPEHGSSEHDRIQEAKQEAEDAQKVDTSGPGPKPLSETGGPKGPTGTQAADDDGPQKESHGEGSGQKWVKSTGVKADGGNFDAAAPGAGKEADRLLEQQGVHHKGDASKDDEGKKSDSLEDKANKPSLGDKIKAKLHKSSS